MADAGAFAFSLRLKTQAESFAGAVGLSAARNNITSTVDAVDHRLDRVRGRRPVGA